MLDMWSKESEFLPCIRIMYAEHAVDLDNSAFSPVQCDRYCPRSVGVALCLIFWKRLPEFCLQAFDDNFNLVE